MVALTTFDANEMRSIAFLSMISYVPDRRGMPSKHFITNGTCLLVFVHCHLMLVLFGHTFEMDGA